MKTLLQSDIVTENIHLERIRKNDINLTVVDTPGFSSKKEFDQRIADIEKLDLKNIIYGITFRIGRSKQETSVLNTLFENPLYYKYLRARSFFVFTNSDELVDTDDFPENAMQDKEYLDKKFVDWLHHSPILKSLIDLGKFDFLVISNKLTQNERNVVSERLMAQLKCTFKEFLVYENEESAVMDDILIQRRLDEKLEFTVDEILNLVNEVRDKGTLNIISSVKHQSLKIENTEQASRLIYEIIKEKGSTLSEKQYWKILERKEPICTIL